MLSLPALTEVRLAVRAGLVAEQGGRPAWRWTGAADAQDFLAVVWRHRVDGLLARHAEELHLPADVAAQLAGWRDAGRLEAMVGLKVLAEITAVLADVEHLVVKGAPLAVRTTGDPTGRGPGDIDLFVAPEQVAAAVDRLTGAGWSGRSGSTLDREAWAWRHQQRVTYELGLERAGTSIDLHWRLDPGHGGLPDFAAAWARRERVDVGVCTVATLGSDDVLPHALRNAAKDSWGSLRSLVDIHRLARDLRLRTPATDRLSRASLGVVGACVGLPAGVTAPEPRPRDLERATVRQQVDLHGARFAGDNITRHVRYLVRSSRSPRDVGVLVGTVLLPHFVTADITERRTVPAVATALRRRVRRLGSSVHGTSP